MQDPPGITRDKHCSPNVTLETCEAVLIVLARLSDLRFEYMYWKGTNSSPSMKCEGKDRVRDLRPGDEVSVDGFKKTVAKVVIFR